jgi:hypothetical protein
MNANYGQVGGLPEFVRDDLRYLHDQFRQHRTGPKRRVPEEELLQIALEEGAKIEPFTTAEGDVYPSLEAVPKGIPAANMSMVVGMTGQDGEPDQRFTGLMLTEDGTKIRGVIPGTPAAELGLLKCAELTGLELLVDPDSER